MLSLSSIYSHQKTSWDMQYKCGRKACHFLSHTLMKSSLAFIWKAWELRARVNKISSWFQLHGGLCEPQQHGERTWPHMKANPSLTWTSLLLKFRQWLGCWVYTYAGSLHHQEVHQRPISLKIQFSMFQGRLQGKGCLSRRKKAEKCVPVCTFKTTTVFFTMYFWIIFHI